jgi:hypothetical protein
VTTPAQPNPDEQALTLEDIEALDHDLRGLEELVAIRLENDPSDEAAAGVLAAVARDRDALSRVLPPRIEEP